MRWPPPPPLPGAPITTVTGARIVTRKYGSSGQKRGTSRVPGASGDVGT